jgi:hypothetical protein
MDRVRHHPTPNCPDAAHYASPASPPAPPPPTRQWPLGCADAPALRHSYFRFKYASTFASCATRAATSRLPKPRSAANSAICSARGRAF